MFVACLSCKFHCNWGCSASDEDVCPMDITPEEQSEFLREMAKFPTGKSCSFLGEEVYDDNLYQ